LNRHYTLRSTGQIIDLNTRVERLNLG